MTNARCALAALATLVAMPGAAAAADPVEEFYKGKTIRVVIGYGVGGGHDIYGRLAADHMPRFIPGRPSIVPQNMPGGGSYVAAKYLYEAAPRDGTVMGVLAQTLALGVVVEGDKVPIKVSEMPYIGRMTTSVELGHGLPGAPFSTFEDVRQREYVVGSSGGSATAYLLPAALNAFAGARFKIVSGYAGINEITLAAERGEVQVVPATGLPVMMAKNPEWITQRKAPIIYGASLKRHPLVPHVPTFPELGLDEDGKAALRVIASSGEFGRALITTPGVPADRLAALRKAFLAMMADPAFKAQMEERRIMVEPASGEALDEIARETARTPKHLLDRIAALVKK